MSKRGSLVALVLLLVVGAVFQPARAAEPLIGIDGAFDHCAGGYAWISVWVDNYEALPNIGGFDLLISYDASALTLVDALPGSLPNSCGWEYFAYRFGATGNCNGPCPSGFVRLVGLAEINNGNNHPSCYLGGMYGFLARMKFFLSPEIPYPGLFTPIRFYWTDCGDNTMTSITGDTTYFSKRVIDMYTEDDITGQPGYGGWQGINGSPNCLAPHSGQVLADTALNFHNGFVDICYPVDMGGDLDLNGFAYEMADLNMFSNYFLHGLDALPSTGRESSIALSDVNADGVCLAFKDITYLMRIIYSDAVPYPDSSAIGALNVSFHQDTTNHNFAVTSDSLLAGAFIVMSGNVTPTFVVPLGFLQDFYFDGNVTRILILGDPGHRYGSGVWFTYQGNGSLLFAETADWHNGQILSNTPGAWLQCGDFNRSNQVDISDAVFLLRYIFASGTPPEDRNLGDINCDGFCDIADAVAMLRFMFAGGPQPCSGCK